MTLGERELVTRALDIVAEIRGSSWVLDEESMRQVLAVARILNADRRSEAERAARACFYVAKEWRDYKGPALEAEGLKLRTQAAESAELCAGRIAPWMSARPQRGTEGT